MTGITSILPALAVFAGLLIGTYCIAVLEYMVTLGARHTRLALLLPAIEGVRLLRQEDLVSKGTDGFLFKSAPFLALLTVVSAALVLPIGPKLVGFDPSIGLFYFIVLLSPFVIALMNAGWSQNTKVGLFGTFRAAAYLISYEVPIGFAAIGPVMATQSLSTTHIVEAQSSLWYVVWQPLGLLIYLLAALFVSYHYPFDSAYSDNELEGGVLAEYSGARLLLFKIALHALFLLLMGMGIVLFFGGWQGPFLPGPVWFVIKTFLLATFVIWGSHFFPRLRHDQMLSLSWKILLPASLLNITLVGILTLIIPGGGR